MIIKSDSWILTFILELEIVQPETLKNEGFGASHKTYQLIPQVMLNCELKTRTSTIREQELRKLENSAKLVWAKVNNLLFLHRHQHGLSRGFIDTFGENLGQTDKQTDTKECL